LSIVENSTKVLKLKNALGIFLKFDFPILPLDFKKTISVLMSQNFPDAFDGIFTVHFHLNFHFLTFI